MVRIAGSVTSFRAAKDLANPGKKCSRRKRTDDNIKSVFWRGLGSSWRGQQNCSFLLEDDSLMAHDFTSKARFRVAATKGLKLNP